MKDTIIHCYAAVFGTKPSYEEMTRILQMMPMDVLMVSEKNGPRSAQFIDKVYVWMLRDQSLRTPTQQKIG